MYKNTLNISDHRKNAISSFRCESCQTKIDDNKIGNIVFSVCIHKTNIEHINLNI